MSIQLFSLYSGSSGNAFLIRTSESTVLIDAGKSCKRLCAALAECNTAPEQIDAIFITHEHIDHIGALPVFLKKHPIPVHMLEKSAHALRTSPAAQPCLRIHTPLYTETVGNVTVSSFPTPHDSAASVGFRISVSEADGTEMYRIGYATDIGHASGHVEEGLLGCDTVILESNHDPEMLLTGPYPYPLKQRIASPYGHLSNPDSAALAQRLYQAGTKRLMLAHLSRENNTPEAALNAHAPVLKQYEDVQLYIASQDAVTAIRMEV